MKSTPEGNKQLTDIFLLFAELRFGRPVEEEEYAPVIHHMLWYQAREGAVIGEDKRATYSELVVRYRRCSLTIPVAEHTVTLTARLKQHGEYVVCGVYPGAAGKARHGQLAELSELLATTSSIERYDALQDAASRSGGHWDGVLRDWMGTRRQKLVPA